MSSRSRKQSKKKEEPPEAGKGADAYSGLSDAEREGLSKFKEATLRRANFIEVDEERIPRSEHEREVGELRARLEKADSKIAELKKDKEGLRRERDDAQSKLEAASGRASELEEKVGSQSREIDRLKKELADAEYRVKLAESESKEGRDAEIDGLNSQIRSQEGSISSLKADLGRRGAELEESAALARSLGEENGRLQREVEELKGELSRMQDRGAEKDPSEADLVCGAVTRVSADAFESDLFADGRYDVRLARDGSYMSFAPDVEGRVVCSNGRMVIPAMADYVPFGSVRTYEALGADGTFFRIELRPKGLEPATDVNRHHVIAARSPYRLGTRTGPAPQRTKD